ncbi:fibrinogen silencer-binding protein-like [Cimex lectularius]|uniref:Regulatory protein zeste n=1 Tax=Cimex lectularius TaxID=79782 RepID=A0A8I6RC21_CIMLE|nr:fibrinogen silencer-binding protein-like [Cimex lectularius]
MSDKKRAANFTKTEENILLGLVRKYVLIVENKKTDAVSAKQKADCWQQITAEYNSHGVTARSSAVLKGKYENIKKRGKKKLSEKSAHIKKTGGGPPLPADDSQDKVLMDILGTQLTGFQSQYDDDKPENESMNVEVVQIEVDNNCNIVSPDKEDELIALDEPINEAETTAALSEPSCSWADYNPRLLRTPVSAPLRKEYKKAPLRDKISKWAIMKTELAGLQQQGHDTLLNKKLEELDNKIECHKKKTDLKMKCILEEHNLRMLHLKIEHERRLQALEQENEILKSKKKIE